MEMHNEVVDRVRDVINAVGKVLYDKRLPGPQVLETSLAFSHLDDPVTVVFVNDDAVNFLERKVGLKGRSEPEAIALFESFREQLEREEADLNSDQDDARLDQVLESSSCKAGATREAGM